MLSEAKHLGRGYGSVAEAEMLRLRAQHDARDPSRP
jgi:hypothetical protein